MVELNKKTRVVGEFIKRRREALNISQRALGQLFDPPVTTQFISNVERGVTPLPPSHIPTLAKALSVQDAEIMALLEKEYAVKLNGRLGRAGGSADQGDNPPSLIVSSSDYEFMKNVYDAYRGADGKTKQAFATICESVLKVSKGQGGSNPPAGPASSI